MKAQFLSLAKNDFVKGLLMAVLTVIAGGVKVFIDGIMQIPSVYPTMDQVTHLLLTGFSVGVLYLLKNFLTNSKDEFLKKDA